MYPRLDEAASEQAGEPRELLSRIRRQQAFVPSGPRLSSTAIDVLYRAGLGELSDRKLRAQTGADELVTAGLMAANGRLGPAGKSLVDGWATARAMVKVMATHGGRQTQLRCWVSNAAVLEAGPPPSSLIEDHDPDADDRSTVNPVSMYQVMDHVARWIGLSPAWTFPLDPGSISVHDFAARTADESMPPPENASPYVRRIWAEPWITWRIGFGPVDDTVEVSDSTGFEMVTVGDIGYLARALSPDGGVDVIQSVSPAMIYRDLWARYGAALGGPPETLE